MAQKAVEIILMRQLASYLAMPIMVFDPDGNLLFYNEPMEAVIGQRFDETGEMTLDEWYALFELTDDDGSALPREERALVIALEKQRAAHRAVWVRKKPDGVRRKLETTAFPLEGQSGRHLGAVVIAWEAHDG
jgi:PAS domain-containing protein